MSECKYRDCDKAQQGNSEYCGRSHQAMAARDRKAQQPSATMQAQHTEDATATVAPTTTPQRIDPPTIDYDEADTYMSDICRRTNGKVTLPGDPTYSGVCKLVDGAWIVP